MHVLGLIFQRVTSRKKENDVLWGFERLLLGASASGDIQMQLGLQKSEKRRKARYNIMRLALCYWSCRSQSRPTHIPDL